MLVRGVNDVLRGGEEHAEIAIAGMRIIDAYSARRIIVNRRSMAAGYSGLGNERSDIDSAMMARDSRGVEKKPWLGVPKPRPKLHTLSRSVQEEKYLITLDLPEARVMRTRSPGLRNATMSSIKFFRGCRNLQLLRRFVSQIALCSKTRTKALTVRRPH